MNEVPVPVRRYLLPDRRSVLISMLYLMKQKCTVRLSSQLGLLKLLKASGCEIVLDPNFAEMATQGRFRSAVGRLRWANQERPWRPDDFGPRRNGNLARLIAEFAVQHGVNVVLAPTHLLETAADGWRSVDLSFLRYAVA
jgi:hypothetical protein